MKQALNKVRSIRWIIILVGAILFTFQTKGQQSLNDYLVQAAENNPGLKAKFNLYLAALEAVEGQAALPDPTLSFGYFISPVETRVGPQQFRVSVSQMFPWMGTTRLRQQAAIQQAKIRYEQFMEAKNQLFLQVKLKWLELYELEQEIRINRENLGILGSYEPVTKAKYEANLVSLADLIRVQINLDEARIGLELLELKRTPLLSDFNTLLNQPVDSEVTVTDTLTLALETIAFDSLLANQPAIKTARLKVELAGTDELLAANKTKPNLGIGLDYVFVGQRTDAVVEDNGRNALMPTVSMSLPVFGRKNRSLKKSAALRTEAMKSNLEAIESQLRNDWQQVAYQLDKALKEIALYRDEVQKTQILLRVLTTEYTNNSRDFEELLASQQRLLALRLSEVRATIAFQRAVFQQNYLTATTLNELK